jgi:glycosyltransferase involved in cell wall biosynthesis
MAERKDDEVEPSVRVRPQGQAFDVVRNERPLSILFFLHSSMLGGAERCFLEVATYLRADPDVVCTVVCPKEGPLVDELRAIGVQVILCAGLSWWAGRSESPLKEAMVSGARTLLELMPTLKEIDPDLVYTETIVIPWGAAAAALMGKPHMWSICEFGELDHGLTFLGGLDEVIQQVEDGASFILTISEAVRLTLFPGSDRARTIYRHSVAPSVKAPDEVAFHRADAMRLAVFGTISEGKGQLDAVEAVARLTQRGRDVELLLAGYRDPQYVKRIEDLVDQYGLRDRVRLVEFIQDPYPTMLSADALLVCSRNEAFGRVAVDGMKLGLPVIYARSGGIPEFMHDGTTGLSYAPGDVEELVRRIEELADDPERAAGIGAAAKEHANAKFVCNAGEILRVFRDLARGEGQRVSIPKQVVAAILAERARERDSQEKTRIKLERTLERTRASETQLRMRLDTIMSSRSYALSQRIAGLVRKLRSLVT